MPDQKFTIEDLRTALRESAGEPDGVNLDGDILDTEFEKLGYDSLALMETASRVERDLQVRLGESVTETLTPRAFLTGVAEHLEPAEGM